MKIQNKRIDLLRSDYMEWIGWTLFVLLNPVSIMCYILVWKNDDIERSLFGSASSDDRFMDDSEHKYWDRK
jgi:hypothetical protein